MRAAEKSVTPSQCGVNLSGLSGHSDSSARYTYHKSNCTRDSDIECLGGGKE